MTAFSLGARLNLGANSTLALSLPQSFVAAKRRQKPAPSSEGAEAAPPHATDFPRRKKCSNRFRVNAVTGRRYNPSVKPTACQLPLHSWLSSAASGGYSEKGKPLPSASARANSRSTSGGRRGSREVRAALLIFQPKKAALRLPFLRWHSACSLRRQRLVRIIFSCGEELPRLRALQVRAGGRGLPRRWRGSPLRRPEASWCRQCGLHCRIR